MVLDICIFQIFLNLQMVDLDFQDGTLTLSEIHQSHLAAQVVFISATDSIETQVIRVRAF